MACVGIGETKAKAQFPSLRNTLNYANLDSQGSQRYKVKGCGSRAIWGLVSFR